MRYREIDSGIILSDWEAKEYLDTHSHEFYHSYFFKKFGLQSEVSIEIERKQEGNTLYFGTFGKCISICPIKYNRPKYYPKFVLIGFIQFIYDIFYDIRKFNFLRNLFFRLKVLYKTFRCFNPKND
nr:MAG: hypothetical protein [uncultured archaeon]